MLHVPSVAHTTSAANKHPPVNRSPSSLIGEIHAAMKRFALFFACSGASRAAIFPCSLTPKGGRETFVGSAQRRRLLNAAMGWPKDAPYDEARAFPNYPILCERAKFSAYPGQLQARAWPRPDGPVLYIHVRRGQGCYLQGHVVQTGQKCSSLPKWPPKHNRLKTTGANCRWCGWLGRCTQQRTGGFSAIMCSFPHSHGFISG